MTSKFTLALLATSIGLLLPLTALADTTPQTVGTGATNVADPTSTKRTATLEIDPGTVSFVSGTNNVIAFNQQNVSDLTNKDTKKVLSSKHDSLILDNYLGTGTPWTLSAQLSQFTDKKHFLTGTMALTVNNPKDDAETTMKDDGTPKNLDFNQDGSSKVPLYQSPRDTGMGQVTLPIDYQLTLNQAKYAGTYSATLTYTFAETADSAVGTTPVTAQ